MIKHCSDDELEQGLIIVTEDMYEDLLTESLSNDRTKIIVKWDKIKNKGKPTYKDFMAHNFYYKLVGVG